LLQKMDLSKLTGSPKGPFSSGLQGCEKRFGMSQSSYW
jgi:hypothetical protein